MGQEGMETGNRMNEDNRTPRMSEGMYRALRLSSKDINDAASFKCKAVRNAERCPNGRSCCQLFPVNEGQIHIKYLRQRLWEDCQNTAKRRTINLVGMLRNS